MSTSMTKCLHCGATRGEHAALSPVNDERWCPLADQSKGGREKFHPTNYFRPDDE